MKRIVMITVATALMLAAAGCGSDDEPVPTTKAITPAATTAPTTDAIYKISRGTGGSRIIKEDIDNLTRANIWVVMPNGDTLSQSDIRQYMENIVLNYTDEHKVTAVTLYVADNEEDVEKSEYTLGRCTYYPGGEIGNAINTKAGDYSSFVFGYEIHSRADKSKPSDLEIEIYDYVNDELEKNSDEDAVNAKAAAKYGISVDELNLIWAKVYTYKH